VEQMRRLPNRRAARPGPEFDNIPDCRKRAGKGAKNFEAGLPYIPRVEHRNAEACEVFHVARNER
jgi:hypothetical protein